MFERFTKDARETVVGAQAQARGLGHRHIGTEHVLLALAGADDPTARTLREHGLDAAALRARLAAGTGSGDGLDPEALRAIGIDLDAVRRATEQNFGEGALDAPRRGRGRPKGHIRFTKEAKKSLELSLRRALHLGHDHIGTGHILLGVLHDDDFSAVRHAWAAGADVGELRADITRMLTSEAA
ncbi:Clp protease N-terminal domain-containing protein [Actinomadura algeriensis]|uniref:ATP-dependent Clp protease ATP-binding subunit ClpA n=1 Tax=Actinomadura algeriensis TaxID=1679523 RepID=A0ABR9JXW6_9ACTN|nr:Clp protease N-terminal domain-containing protein [Actinomadura algeriensis]MBE1535419.1 ATP-dependent Clp protease ATP-binding subunit ClpA [Actinomadura algeriensis]